MERSPLPPRPGAMTELEERILAAAVCRRLFSQPGAPAKIGRYRVRERLGQGGMGVVFSAHDDQLDRPVAIKLLHASRGQVTGEARERLRREALALGRLSHPNVVAVHEFGEAEGQLFVVMELVAGVTLQTWLGERPRAVAEIVAVLAQAGQGLAAAHAVGLIHRDFKPENVLIGRDGRVRVVDFGLARHALEAEVPGAEPPQAGPLDSVLTATGALLGTPAYMAPEQVGALPVDARSDQFSFCVALHEALYGARPFVGATLEAYVAAVAAGAVRSPSAGRRVPRRLRRALLRGLAYDPDARWPDMPALLAALTARSRARMLGVAALLVALALGLAWSLSERARQAERVEREATAQARVDALAAELPAMLGTDDGVATGERRIGDLVTSPEVRGTEAAAVLWSRWAELLGARGDPSAAAWANAYARTRDPDARRQALLGLARDFDRRHEPLGLAHALALLAAEAPGLADAPEVTAMRFKVAARGRDLAAAQRLAAVAGPEALAVAPVLAALARGRPHPQPADPRAALHHVRWWALPGRPPVVAWPDGRRAALLGGRGEVQVIDDAGRELVRWPTPGKVTAAAAADLDGDGAPELLVGLAADERGLHRLEAGPDGRWSPPRAPLLAALASDVNGLAVADLDGDTQPEVVVGLGAWQAYDIRVLRPTVEGTLVPVARRKVGLVMATTILRTPQGPRIAALIVHSEPSPRTLPPDRSHGLASGVHLLRLDGGALTLERSLPLAGPTKLLAGDVDGDGLDDLVVETLVDGSHAIDIARQRADGSFAQVKLGDIGLVGADQLDDDAAVELVLSIDGAWWATGIDGEPSTLLPPSSRATPPGVGHALELARAGASAEVLALARAGLGELALSALLDSARGADPPTRRRLHFAGATLASEQRDRAKARALLEDAADEPELRADALWRLARDHEQRGDLAGALRLLDGLLASTGLDAALRAEAEALRARLAALADSRQSLPLLFSRGAQAPWRALSPAQLRADPVARTLTIEAAAELPPAVAWPLRWDGRQLLVELDLRLDALEWGSSLQLRLVDETGAVAWRIGLGVFGGGGVHKLMLIHQSDAELPYAAWLGPIPAEGARRRLLLRVDGASVGFRILDDAGAVAREVERVNGRPYAGGTYRLELGADPLWRVPEARARVRVEGLAIAGAELLARPRPTGVEQAAALLVDGETHEAAALLEGLADADPRARLWLAVALAELGAADRSAELLRQTLTAAPDLEREFVAWLRTRTAAVTPLIRRAFGLPRHLELVERAWSNPLRAGLDAGATRALRSALAGIDEACDAGPRCSPMLHALGRAHAAAFDLDRARRALLAALADAPPAIEAGRIELDLAALEASRGDPAAAFAHARRALELAEAPEIVRDMLRVRPELQPLLREPAWQELLAADDGLP